jgi:hypothetical protein
MQTLPLAGVVTPLWPCTHTPKCPPFAAPDHDAARVIADHHDQGWILLCNGTVVWDDTGEVLPDRSTVAPHRPEPPHITLPACAAEVE